MRVAISLVLILAGLGIVGVAFAGTDGLREPGQKLALAPVESKGWPAGMGAVQPAEAAPAAVPAGAETKPAETKPAETKPAETKPAETKPAETKPAETKPAETKPAETKPAETKPAETKPAAARAPEARPAETNPVAAPAGAPPAEAKPAAAAAGTAAKAPAPAPAAAPAKPAGPAAPAAANDAMLNLRASDTADVFVDGKKVGTSPVLGLKVKPGKHKIRFDCYEASGATTKGPEVVMEVRANEEKDKEYECTAEARAPSHDESPY